MRGANLLLFLGACASLATAASHTKNGTCSAHGHSSKHKHHRGHKSGGAKKPLTSGVAVSAGRAGSNKGNATVSSPSSSIGHNVTSSSIGHGTTLIQVVDKACGTTGATLKSSSTSGPNGAASWLNCGISQSDPSSGWTPPSIQMNQLVVKTLEDFQDTTFSACKAYIDLFNKYGQQNDLPPIFLASFAMQESGCNPNASGDAGDAFGLMQITSDKCGNAPNGNCNDPDYNIMTGASYFAGQLKAFNGNVLLAIGQYNGWTPGLSYNAATAAANTGCCDCQNNLAYLHQFLNGWAQGLSNVPAPPGMNNLAVCGQ